jgi:hypothetical protein
MAQWVRLTEAEGHPVWVNLDRIAYLRESRTGATFERTLIYFAKDFSHSVKETVEDIVGVTASLRKL